MSDSEIRGVRSTTHLVVGLAYALDVALLLLNIFVQAAKIRLLAVGVLDGLDERREPFQVLCRARGRIERDLCTGQHPASDRWAGSPVRAEAPAQPTRTSVLPWFGSSCPHCWSPAWVTDWSDAQYWPCSWSRATGTQARCAVPDDTDLRRGWWSRRPLHRGCRVTLGLPPPPGPILAVHPRPGCQSSRNLSQSSDHLQSAPTMPDHQ